MEGNTMIGRESIVLKRPETAETTVGSEIVLMSLERGKIFGLGQIGSEVWRRLEGHATLDTVIRGLAEDYDAPEERLEADVLRLMNYLDERALIQVQ